MFNAHNATELAEVLEHPATSPAVDALKLRPWNASLNLTTRVIIGLRKLSNLRSLEIQGPGHTRIEVPRPFFAALNQLHKLRLESVYFAPEVVGDTAPRTPEGGLIKVLPVLSAFSYSGADRADATKLFDLLPVTLQSFSWSSRGPATSLQHFASSKLSTLKLHNAINDADELPTSLRVLDVCLRQEPGHSVARLAPALNRKIKRVVLAPLSYEPDLTRSLTSLHESLRRAPNLKAFRLDLGSQWSDQCLQSAHDVVSAWKLSCQPQVARV